MGEPEDDAAAGRRPPRTAAIDFAIVNGDIVGTVSIDGHEPENFSGSDELERLLKLGRGHLILVQDERPELSPASLTPLSEMETRIVSAALAGASNREIADRMFYSVKSVEAYLTRIYRRYGLAGRHELNRLEGLSDAIQDLEPLAHDAELVAGGAADRAAGRRVHLQLVVV